MHGSYKVHLSYRRNKTETWTAYMPVRPGDQDLVSDQVVTCHKDWVTDQVPS
jgi:hypothetical protein